MFSPYVDRGLNKFGSQLNAKKQSMPGSSHPISRTLMYHNSSSLVLIKVVFIPLDLEKPFSLRQIYTALRTLDIIVATYMRTKVVLLRDVGQDKLHKQQSVT